VKTSFLACFGLLSPPHGRPHPINGSDYFSPISSDQPVKKMSFILRSSMKLKIVFVDGQLAHFWPFLPPLHGWCLSWGHPGGHLRVPTSYHTSTTFKKLGPVQSDILVDFWRPPRRDALASPDLEIIDGIYCIYDAFHDTYVFGRAYASL